MATKRGTTAKDAAGTASMDLGVTPVEAPPRPPPVALDAGQAPAPELAAPEAKTTQPAAAPTVRKVGPYHVGRNYFLRSVTSYFLGTLAEVTDQELVLTNASWVADTDRFADFLKSGIPEEPPPGIRIEVEPYPDGEVIVGRGALVDACLWPHALPREIVPSMEKP